MSRAPFRADEGFTLLELLLVFAMLGILAGIAVPTYARSLIRADATELRTRIHAIELATRETEAITGALPAADAGFAEAPTALASELGDSLFSAPYGVALSYQLVPGAPFGVGGRIPAILARATGGRAGEVLDALAEMNPTAVLRLGSVAVYPLEGAVRTAPTVAVAGSQGGSGTGPTGTDAGTPATTPDPPTTTTGGTTPATDGGTGSGGGTTGTGPGTATPPPSYTPPPAACLSGQLPPGQAKRCASGGGQSAWFHGGSHGHS